MWMLAWKCVNVGELQGVQFSSGYVQHMTLSWLASYLTTVTDDLKLWHSRCRNLWLMTRGARWCGWKNNTHCITEKIETLLACRPNLIIHHELYHTFWLTSCIDDVCLSPGVYSNGVKPLVPSYEPHSCICKKPLDARSKSCHEECLNRLVLTFISQRKDFISANIVWRVKVIACNLHRFICRIMYIECTPQTCPCGDQCANMRIQKQTTLHGLEKIQTTDRGCGVKTTNLICSGVCTSV